MSVRLMSVRKKSPRSVISRVLAASDPSRAAAPARAAGDGRVAGAPRAGRSAARLQGERMRANPSSLCVNVAAARHSPHLLPRRGAISADDGHQQQCDEPVARRPHCRSGRHPRLCAPREALPAPGPHSTARCMLITHARIQTRIASARPSGRVQDGTSHAARVGVQYCTASR